MITSSNFIYNYLIPGAQGIFAGLGVFITFEVLKDKVIESYKNHQLNKFNKSLIQVRQERDNKTN